VGGDPVNYDDPLGLKVGPWGTLEGLADRYIGPLASRTSSWLYLKRHGAEDLYDIIPKDCFDHDGVFIQMGFDFFGGTLFRMGGNVLGAARGAAKTGGRTGDQARLRELGADDKVSSADRGWIKQEQNTIERGQRTRIRRPPGKELAHERGREAARGYGYEHSNLQDKDLHKLQHKYDDFGRKNKERPVTDDD
jgi:hypothetical protein